MKIISWNVNGIRSVLKKGFAEWLRENDPDILCLQETRALEDQVPEEIWNPSGYTSYWNPAEKKGYSGVSIWTKIKPEQVIYGLENVDYDREGRIIQLIFKDWVLINGYFPNGGNGPDRLQYKMEFYDVFLEVSNRWVSKGYKVISCGDYNTCHKEIDIARPKENRKVSGFLPEECAWMDKYVDEGYTDTFRYFYPEAKEEYSWWSNRGGARERNVGWRIDYFFISNNGLSWLKGAGIQQKDEGSDHCPIYLSIT